MYLYRWHFAYIYIYIYIYIYKERERERERKRGIHACSHMYIAICKNIVYTPLYIYVCPSKNMRAAGLGAFSY